MLVETLEWTNEDGGYFKKRMEEVDFELKTEREHFVCAMCRINRYPECMDYCKKWETSRKTEQVNIT